MVRASTFRWPIATIVAFGLALVAAILLIVTDTVPIRFRLAALAATAAFAFLAARPDRRIICIMLWVLIHPLSIEKIVPFNGAEAPGFADPSLAINASDGPLVLLIIFLVAETIVQQRSAFRWSRLATVLSVFLLWSLISYALHAFVLGDDFVHAMPLTIAQDVRLLLFVLIVQSAIRTRGEVVLTLFTMAFAVLFQSVLVGLSYTLNETFSYASLGGTVDPTKLAGFASEGAGVISRANGTLGHVNEQAKFHVFMTLPLVGLLVARNTIVRYSCLIIIAGSALALVLTFSRGAWLAFPAGLLVCAVAAQRRGMITRTGRAIGLLMGFGAMLGIIVLAQPIYQRLFYGDSGATESRLGMVVLGYDLFRTDPLIGVGPGEFAEAALKLYPPGQTVSESQAPGMPDPAPRVGRVDISEAVVDNKIQRRPLPAHNKYILVLSELGIPGLAIWVWFFIEFIAASRRCARGTDRLLVLLGMAGLGVAIAEMIYMMMDLFTENKPLELMFFVPALIVAASRCAENFPARAALNGARSAPAGARWMPQ